MRIGIYVETAKDEQPRGVALHIVNLLRALYELDLTNEYYLYCQRPVIGRPAAPPHFPQGRNFLLRPLAFPDGWIGSRPRMWWNWRLANQIQRDRLDVFHGPTHMLPKLGQVRGVVTIHDLAYFKMDDLYSEAMTLALREWTRISLDRASGVIALSRNTASDVEELGVPAAKIRVIYGGGNVLPEESIQTDKVEDVRSRLGLPDRFVLYVGTLHPRKNVPFLLRAYAKLRRAGEIDHKLVLVGKPDTAAREVADLIEELQISSDVIITGYVAEWEIPLIYKMADLFVLPTRYEGFTLVTLEAMHYGVPVIATDTSSIREGVGDAGMLVPVDDVPALSAAMAAILRDPQLRGSLISKGREQSRKFTWHECARQTLALYHEVCSSQTNGCTGEGSAVAVALVGQGRQ